MQGTGINTAELTAWLTRTAQTIDRSLRDAARASAVAELSESLTIPAPLSVLAQVALLDDCLRVAVLAIDAGGDVEPGELARIEALVDLAAAKYFTVLPAYESFGDGAATSQEVERFLETYRSDAGPFGHVADHSWRGVALVQRVDHITHNASPLRDHEHMLARIMDVVFAGRATQIEAEARRQLRAQFEPAPGDAGMDPRAMAFCREDGPEVFSSVAHGSQVHVRDPFDVESIHSEARAVFHRQIDRALTPAQHALGHGRTMLVLGESGSGKTHLLRALRHQLCSQRRGYAGYLQMSTEIGDYARYVLRNFIDSMERPYDAPTLGESSLLYLSNGLAEGYVEHAPGDLEALRGGELEGDALHDVVGRMVDCILRTDGLSSLEPDLIYALLLLQRRDAAIQRRVIQFLRCESLTGHEQRLLGGLAPRLQPEDPMRTLKQLGAIAYELQMAVMVFLVDQVEDALPDAGNITRLQQAFDALRAVADAIPSAIVVISCLTNVYEEISKRLTRSLRDRLEHEPPPTRLTHQRSAGEIEDMLVRRLDHLYAAFDVAWHEDDPIYPFAPEQLAELTNFRTRDCLAVMYRFHQECIAAGEILRPRRAGDAEGLVVEPTTDSAKLEAVALTRLDQLWNDARVAGGIEIDESDAGLLALVAEALQEAARENGFELTIEESQRDDSPQLIIEGIGLPRRVLEVCNRAPQGGRLAAQLESLTRQAIDERLIAVALRRSDFEFTRGSAVNKRLGELRAVDGLPVVLEDAELRAIAAARKLDAANLPRFSAWKRARKPICDLTLVREILDLNTPRTLTGSGWQQPRKHPRGTTVNGVTSEAFARAPATSDSGVTAIPAPTSPVTAAGSAPTRAAPGAPTTAAKAAPSPSKNPTLPMPTRAAGVSDHGSALPPTPLSTAAASSAASPTAPPPLPQSPRLSGRSSTPTLAGTMSPPPPPARATAVHQAATPPPLPPHLAPRATTATDPALRLPPARAATSSDPAMRPPAVRTPTDSSRAFGVRLGVTAALRAEPVALPLDQITHHVAFLGSAGSGKTGAALSLIERLLEQGVSALLVDRKGDLARYASDAWWTADSVGTSAFSGPAAASRDRRRALRGRIDVALYTPGNALGRPLRLPLVAPMHDATSGDRDQLSTFAASGLAAVMGYGRGAATGHKQSVLMRAIGLCSEQTDGEVTLEMLYDCVANHDPELLSAVGGLKRYFAPLAEDLQSLLIQSGALLAGAGEPLDLPRLLPPPEGGRARLTIINTSALGEGAALQFWMSRLIVALDRLAASRPRKELQGVVMFDDAELYLPATSQPPTKEPMLALLRRARGRGLGVVLASGSPADLDFKAKERISTWLVGKVTQDRAAEKLRGLFTDAPNLGINVGARLASQPPGQFFLLGASSSPGNPITLEVKVDRPLLELDLAPALATEPNNAPAALTQQQIGALARETARR